MNSHMATLPGPECTVHNVTKPNHKIHLVFKINQSNQNLYFESVRYNAKIYKNRRSGPLTVAHSHLLALCAPTPVTIKLKYTINTV